MFGRVHQWFGKKTVRNEEALTLGARLSFRNSQIDPMSMQYRLSEDSGYAGDAVEWQQKLLRLEWDGWVALEEEVALLVDYAEWYRKHAAPSFEVKLDYRCTGKDPVAIRPLILFPLVQRAFWYGYNGMVSHPVRIRILASMKSLTLDVSSRVNHHIEDPFANVLMTDFRLRLEHQYPEKYNLLLNSNSNVCKTTLQLELI